jgi:hypothetical protein
MPTVFDPSYKGVGQKVGLEIWRVEKLAVVKKPPTDKSYEGQFFTGDSYIVLQTKVSLLFALPISYPYSGSIHYSWWS